MGDTFTERKVRNKNKNKKMEQQQLPVPEDEPSREPPRSVSFKFRLSDIWENPEVAISSMASGMKMLGSAVPEFFLGKFTYVQAFSLIMLVAERALKVEKQPPMHPYLIYTVAALCFISGVMLSAKIKIQSATLIYSLVLAYLTFNAYTNKKFNYSRHERNRISGRHLACLGIYLIYAFIKGNRQSKMMQRAGELCIAISLLGTAYIINESYEDRKAVIEFIPGGNYARYFLTLILASAGLCFLSGYFLKDIFISVAFCMMFYMMLVDIRFYYWTYRGMAYWNQMRIVIDDVNLVTGCFLLSNYYENIAEEANGAGVEDRDEDDEEDEEEDHVKSD